MVLRIRFGESFTTGNPIVKKRRGLSSNDVHNFFLIHRILANPFPTHQVMPGANVFHGLASKLRDRFLTFSWRQNQRGPLGLGKAQSAYRKVRLGKAQFRANSSSPDFEFVSGSDVRLTVSTRCDSSFRSVGSGVGEEAIVCNS